MNAGQAITNYSLRHYRLVMAVMVAVTLALGALIPLIRIDTDPENMLSPDEPVRIFHNQTKEEFTLSDIVVVGIVNNKNASGVFNPESLARIYELTDFAMTKLRWPDEKDPKQEIGVIEVDLLAPSTVDHIGQGEPGFVNFEWLMKEPPATEQEALEIRDKALSNPLLKGTVVSEDGKAICLYLPLTSKDLSHKVYVKLKEKIATFDGDEEYHITGLPVAEDTFGYEMFIQMAISAPLAMAVIFILMLLFFRKLVLIISPMIVALVSVISTMGLLIGLGHPVHIMSSMIPIFLMPIAVVDSVHILSEFFDLYTKQKGKVNTTREVMGNLFTPMLYTSLTSAAGFASLALTPIPPVQVFGIFIAIGIMFAWVCTVTFVPAYIMMIREKSLGNFGHEAAPVEKQSWLNGLLNRTGSLTYTSAKPILRAVVLVTAVAVYGILRIRINDNPVKWFSKSHPIRKADIELNKHFGGTYMAYLVLDQADLGTLSDDYLQSVRIRLNAKASELQNEFPIAKAAVEKLQTALTKTAARSATKESFLEKLGLFASEKLDLPEPNGVYLQDELVAFFDLEKVRLNVFKQPEVLRYIVRLQDHLEKTGLVGKSNSVADVVRKVYQELTDGSQANYIIPQSLPAVGNCIMQFQNSHTPDDLWHLVTKDFRHANIWLQLTSGDNKDMNRVVGAVGKFMKENPPPVRLKHNWAGLTYINVIWQDKMVWGMLQSFLGSFIVVFIMMSILFRSPLWGIICMIPLTVTITVIYGIIGLAGKDYDMPVAVLSALTLGMAVDFAIHFLERARTAYSRTNSWETALPDMFAEPARAISRNVLVIAIGFLPLLAASLVPYKTVGIFLCAIMALSGVITLLVLPTIIRLLEERLFKQMLEPLSPTCNCAFCVVISVAVVLLVALNIHQFAVVGWSSLAWISIIAIPIMALACGIISRRQACKRASQEQT